MYAKVSATLSACASRCADAAATTSMLIYRRRSLQVIIVLLQLRQPRFSEVTSAVVFSVVNNTCTALEQSNPLLVMEHV